MDDPDDRPATQGFAPSTGPRLAGIEGLRALAAGSIVLVHVWGFSTGDSDALGAGTWRADILSNLSLGVTLFFALSGFLLYRPFVASIARGNSLMSIGSYFRNRALRIVPAYWAILALCALVFGAVEFRTASGELGFGYMANAHLIQSALLVQHYWPSTLGIGIGPAWSLATEVVFYCVLPVLVLAAARVARPAADRHRRVLVLLGPPLLLLLLGLSGKFAAGVIVPGRPTAGYDANWHSVIERSFWAQADLFSFGMLAAVLHVEMSDGRLRLPAWWRPVAVTAGLFTFLVCAATLDGAQQSYLLQNTGVALGIGLLLASVVLPGPPAARPSRAVRLLETRWLVATGVVSYSLFLWHLPVIMWLEARGVTAGGWWGLLPNTVIVGAVAGGLSALTYRYVEKPALRRKHSMRHSRGRAAPAEIAA